MRKRGLKLMFDWLFFVKC